MSSTFTGLGNGVLVSVFDPFGSRLSGPLSMQGSGFVEPITLPVTGTHTVLVDPLAGWGGQLTAQVHIVDDVTGTITAGGAPVTVTTTVPGQIGVFSFDATDGQRVSVNLWSGTFTGLFNGIAVSIVDSYGVRVAGPTNVQNNGFLDTITLAAGTYTVVFDPLVAFTGSITAQLHTVADISGTIVANGSPVTLTTTVPGQNGRLTFSGSASQQVSIGLSSGTFTGLGHPGVVVALLDPQGTQVGSAITVHSSGTLGPLTLPSGGTYTILFDPHGPFVGSLTASLTTTVPSTPTPNCDARASATPEVTSAGPGRIQVTVRGGSPLLQSVTIKSLFNARLYVGGQLFTGQMPTMLTSSSGAPIVFVLEQINPIGAITVPLQIVDGCGIWETFVGAGTGALNTPTPTPTQVGYGAGRSVAVAATPGATSFERRSEIDHEAILAKIEPGGRTMLATPTPGSSASAAGDEVEPWVPTAEHRRGAWWSGRPRPQTMAPPLTGHESRGLTSNGLDLMVGGERVVSVAISSPQGRARHDAHGAPIWEGQLLGPGGEPRGRLELVPDQQAARGRADLVQLTGRAYGPGDEPLATVQVSVETGELVGDDPRRAVAATALTVRYGGQRLQGVDVRIGELVGPPGNPANSPGAGPAVRPAITGSPSPVASPSPAAPTLPVAAPPTRSGPILALDGRSLRSVSLELADLSPPLLPNTTALTGQVLTLADEPLANVTLAIGKVTAQTDKTGRFLLAPLSAGRQVLTIDGRTASRPGRAFGVFQAGVDLKKGELNVLEYTIWMPRLDTEHAVTIPPTTTREVVLTTPHIPGLEIHLPPGAQIRDVDGKPATEVGITAIPLDRTPFPIPRFVEVPVYFTVQPGAATVDSPSGAWVVYPNYSSLPPGARADFWQYDPKKRGWFVYGQGTVTADGTQVVPDTNVRIFDFTVFMFNGHGWGPPPEGPQPDDGHADGDPVYLETGLFVLEKTDLALPDTLPLSLTRTYRPRDAQNRPFGVGGTHPYEIFLWSANQYTEVHLVLPNGARVHYPRISPGTHYLDAVFEHTTTPTVFYKSRIAYVGFGWNLTFQDGTVFRFGDNAGLEWIRDRYGNTIHIVRSGTNFYNEGAGPIRRLISPNGRWISFSYDGGNRITQATDNIGRTVNYTYDGGGRLVKVTDPTGGETEYTYDASHRMLTIEDARGITFLTNEYDGNGRVTKQTQADGTTYQFAYTLDGSGRVTQTDVTNPRGKVRRVTFNANRRVTSDTLALGAAEQQTVTYERRAADNFILSITDPLNRRATFAYDVQGNVTSITELAGTANARTTTLTYEPTFQQVKTIVDPLNRTTTFAYDGSGNLTGVIDPLNHASTATYDPRGRVTSVKDPLNKVTQLTYSGPDLVAVTDPLNRTAITRPDGAGRIVAAVDPLGNSARIEYDALNQMTRLLDPLGNATAFTYDRNGNLLT